MALKWIDALAQSVAEWLYPIKSIREDLRSEWQARVRESRERPISAYETCYSCASCRAACRAESRIQAAERHTAERHTAKRQAAERQAAGRQALASCVKGVIPVTDLANIIVEYCGQDATPTSVADAVELVTGAGNAPTRSCIICKKTTHTPKVTRVDYTCRECRKSFKVSSGAIGWYSRWSVTYRDLVFEGLFDDCGRSKYNNVYLCFLSDDDLRVYGKHLTSQYIEWAKSPIVS